MLTAEGASLAYSETGIVVVVCAGSRIIETVDRERDIDAVGIER